MQEHGDSELSASHANQSGRGPDDDSRQKKVGYRRQIISGKEGRPGEPGYWSAWAFNLLR
jgi:hypothetical protein